MASRNSNDRLLDVELETRKDQHFDGTGDLEGNFEDSPLGELSTKVPSSRFTRRVASVVVLLCFAFNVHGVLRRANGPYASYPTWKDTYHLPVVDSYLGLGNQLSVNTTYEKLLSVSRPPSVMTQVSAEQPDRVWPDDSLRYFDVDIGAVSPDTRRFYVSPRVSTITQFRVVDYGMERCHLLLDLDAGLFANSRPEGWPGSFINVWMLDEREHRLDVSKLSWRTRPRRGAMVASWNVSGDAPLTTGILECLSGQYLTFEFECNSPGCLVDFLNGPTLTAPAITLIQTSSLLDLDSPI